MSWVMRRAAASGAGGRGAGGRGVHGGARPTMSFDVFCMFRTGVHRPVREEPALGAGLLSGPSKQDARVPGAA